MVAIFGMWLAVRSIGECAVTHALSFIWCGLLMDDLKNPSGSSAGQVEVSLIKKCLQNGDAKLALQYCHEMLVVEPKQIQILLFAAIASRSLGWLDDAIDFINRAMAVAPNLPGIHSILGDIMLLQKKPGTCTTSTVKG